MSCRFTIEGDDMTNIYSDPAAFGYELVGMIEREPDYDFNMLCVWRQLSDGRLFWAEDAGCSCPSPFEDYTDPAGSEWISPIDRTTGEFVQAVRDLDCDPADKPRILAMVAGSRFGVTTFREGSTVTVYA
jgi:hypothetical protein